MEQYVSLSRRQERLKMERFLKTIDAISEWAGNIVCYLIILIVLVMVYETVARYGFNSPTMWANHLSWNLVCPLFLCGGAYALRHKAHVGMDIVYNRFPLRMRAIVDLVTATLFFAFCGVLLWKGLDWSLNSLRMAESSGPPLYWVIYPVKFFIPIGGFFMVLQGTAKFIRDLMTAIRGEQYEY